MKFISLSSRGGNYLVVANNIAWLRSAEHGQTLVGIVGGSPLLVTGSIEETAQTIMAGGSVPENDPVADQ
jgi:periplasmic protein TonB